MRIPLSWLKEYIHIQKTPEEIAKLLTMAGIEVESYELPSFPFQGVIVGEVLQVEKHPNADKLCVAVVTDGQENYQVVCGAPNCRKGLKTAFARIGASFKEENGTDFTIKKTKIRGVESSGMLCSGKELGVSEDADGIIELSPSTSIGTPIEELYGDPIFEISLTPNLGHCSSVLGIARELSAATGLPLHLPQFTLQESEDAIEENVLVNVPASKACPRYTCRLIKNVQVAPSPDWLRSRLEKCGLRPVNNIVDITNYVLLEMGHPLHAFDFNQLQGKQIVVKEAEADERLTTLDNKERVLSAGDLLICDENRPVALAGIMGGINSEVGEQTHHVLIESAYFDPIAIRRTSKRLGLSTDASKRFERGTDPNGLIAALDRVSYLIQQVAGGTICADFIDIASQNFPEKEIRCRFNRINQLLGINISQGEVESIFQRLHFHYHWEDANTLIVQIPTYRVDIQSEVDLIEEVARLYGYNNIPQSQASYHPSQLPNPPLYYFEKEIRARLMGEGLQEFLTSDLIGPSLLQIVQDSTLPQQMMVQVMNPTSIEQSILRTSLLPGLLQVAKYNIDHDNQSIGGFEIGRVHFLKEGHQFQEPTVVGILLSGQAHPYYWEDKPRTYDFFDLKGIVENLLSELGITSPIFKNLGMTTFHNGRQASVFVDSLELGSFGEVHPAILRRLDVSQRILFGEFNLADLMQVSKSKERISALAIYPGSERDWTLTIQERVPFTQLMQMIQENTSTLLEKVSLLNIYRSDKLGEGFQNITLRFMYRDPTKTIEQERVESEHQKLMIEVLKKLGDKVK